MHPNTAERLLALNHQFYQTFSIQFSQTRRRIQPGVRRFFNSLPRDKTLDLLDLGCGNGELAVELAQEGRKGSYLGLDFSSGLLDEAQTLKSQANLSREAGLKVDFGVADLAGPDWDRQIMGERFRLITAFAVLHHIPGVEYRKRLIERVRAFLETGGWFVHSNWQFLNSPRLASRVVDWTRVEVDPAQLDPGDFLLDWRAGGNGLRYVHHFSEPELEGLAHSGGFEVKETYLSDGKEGNLGLYQIWEAV